MMTWNAKVLREEAHVVVADLKEDLKKEKQVNQEQELNVEVEAEEERRVSFSFGGTQQTGRAGTPVPLVYGEIFTGSVVISGGIDTEQVQA